MKDHISQPVAIGLCTARKLSGRRSQLPVSSQWPKLSHKHASIQATAATPSGQHANPPSQIKYMWQPRTYSSQHERPHQPARRNWSLHCPKAQWKEKSIACLIPVAKTVAQTRKHSSDRCHTVRPARKPSHQIKRVWQPRTYSSQHERPHQPARRNWSLHCSKAQWKEKSIACLIPVANTVTPTPKHASDRCHTVRPARQPSHQIKYMWQPRTYSSQHERPHQPARRNWSLHCPKAQWKEKSIACLIPVANTVTPTRRHSTGVCHMFRPSRKPSHQIKRMWHIRT